MKCGNLITWNCPWNLISERRSGHVVISNTYHEGVGTLADLIQPHARTIFSHAVGSPLICWNGMAHARLVSTLGHELDRSAGGYCACAGRGLGYLVCPLVCAVISPFCEIVMTGATRRELTARQGAPLDLYPRVNGEGGGNRWQSFAFKFIICLKICFTVYKSTKVLRFRDKPANADTSIHVHRERSALYGTYCSVCLRKFSYLIDVAFDHIISKIPFYGESGRNLSNPRFNMIFMINFFFHLWLKCHRDSKWIGTAPGLGIMQFSATRVNLFFVKII
jgi:hypothetical protein